MTSRSARRWAALAIRRVLPAALALLVILPSCAQREEETPAADPGSLDQAVGRLRAIVEETADAVLPGRPRTPREGNGERAACMDELGGFTEQSYASWGVAIELEDDRDVEAILDRTIDHWESAGYRVDTDSARVDPPSLFLEFDGYNVEMLFNTKLGKAFLGGSTPCLPRD
jgi:hypothetical protein